jgi:hypothetical protein
MNESTVSSAFQKLFREMVQGAVLVKHADKSMIGLPDASVTYNKVTLWMEYKFIGPKTKGVAAEFRSWGNWSPDCVAEASPTQYDMMQRLGKAGNALYLFWVLDNSAKRKKVRYITTWDPITHQHYYIYSNRELVTFLLLHYFNTDVKV